MVIGYSSHRSPIHPAFLPTSASGSDAGGCPSGRLIPGLGEDLRRETAMLLCGSLGASCHPVLSVPLFLHLLMLFEAPWVSLDMFQVRGMPVLRAIQPLRELGGSYQGPCTLVGAIY